MGRAFSIGTANRTPAEFVAMLHEGGVVAFADIRRYPDSSRLAHFRRAAFRAFLKEAGIAYHALGADLGGFRDGGYEKHAASVAFARGIDRLAALAGAAPTAFGCAERDPRSCHRRFIAAALEARGIEVVHLLDPGRAASHAERFREVQRGLFE